VAVGDAVGVSVAVSVGNGDGVSVAVRIGDEDSTTFVDGDAAGAVGNVNAGAITEATVGDAAGSV